ncbi:unnamed protein product [Wickerhamomyces anomalus]
MSSKEDEILRAVENGTFKYAQQLCSKLLKKNPNVAYYKVLNSYILLHSGKEKEAVDSALSIMEDVPSDIKSLELLNEIFNEVGLTSEAVLVYENAAKKHKTFDILRTWFHFGCEHANVRIIQKAAMAMKNSSRLFKLWAAFASYMVANLKDASPVEKSLFPKLGLKTIEQCEPLKNEQEVFILVKLLEQNKSLDKIPEAILKFSKQNKLDLELQIILLKTFDQLEDWENLYKWSHTVLIDYKLDDFNTWKYLIKSSIKLNKDINDIIESYNSRNSKLAKIELQSELGYDVHEAVFEYMKSLGHKACAFPDIKNYAEKIDQVKFLEWLNGHKKSIDDDRGLIWNVNVVKFKALFNRDLFKSEEFINENIQLWNKSKHLLSKKSKTDYFNGDEFILFIVQSLLSIDFSVANIVLSIIILENTVIKDDHEFHLRLWLIQLYSIINCHTQAKHHYDALKIKNVQHDILDHYIISRLSTQFPNADELKKSFSIYRANENETVYYVKIGFNNGAFNKLESMIEFQQRLNDSILKKHEVIQVSDNRDFNILWNVGIDEELEFKDQLLENIPGKSYIKLNEVQERLVNGQDVPLADPLSFQRHADLLSKVKELYAQVPKPPKTLSWKVNNSLVSIIDTAKSAQVLLSSTQKVNKKDHSELKELNLSLLQKIRDDTILDKKVQITDAINNLKSELSDNEYLKKLNISNASKDKILEIIGYSNNEAFKLLRIL